ncbi:DEKNAAC104612 [Brettanomyces naardenensis]|uniref:ADP-ribosylation factor GTPase-activating protein n=1 Tax=Brettanomyces naardenensis TaxID=13370 RepID=A0A448YR81_BRENA|nr:DEKNAAC104612 [Brettanomyces naardenensis]
MDTVTKQLLGSANATNGSGLYCLEFMDEPGTQNQLHADFELLRIESGSQLELVQHENAGFLLKVPSNYNRLKVILTEDLSKSIDLLHYTIDDQSPQQVQSNPFWVSLAKVRLFTKFSLFNRTSKLPVATFEFYKVLQSVSVPATLALSAEKQEMSSGEKSSGLPTAFPAPRIAIDDESSSPFPVTLEDGPIFRQTLSEFEHKIPRILSDLTKASEVLESFENLSHQTVTIKVSLVRVLQSICVTSMPDTLKNSTAEDAMDSSLIDSLNSLVDDSYKNVVKAIRHKFSSRPVNLDTLANRKRIFEEESKKYYDWLSKLLGSGRTKDEKLLSKRKAFELSKIDYLDFLFDTMMTISLRFRSPNEAGKSFLDTYSFNQKRRKSFRSAVDRCSSLSQLKSQLATAMLPNPGETSGILFTQGGQGKSGWHKQWVVLKNGKLTEYMDWRKGASVRNSPIDISLCNIKSVDLDKRRNCFRLITSTGLERYFQAVDEEDRDSWVQSLFNAGQQIRFHRESGTNNSHVPVEKNLKGFSNNTLSASSAANLKSEIIRRVSSVSLVNLRTVQSVSESNLVCCECGCGDAVEWISLNLLVIFCIKCSSCHRSLGTSISKVRSLKLDSFDRESLSLLNHINNESSNSYYESLLSPEQKINASVSDEARLQFITSKYSKRVWFDYSKVPDPSSLLIHGIKGNIIREILKSIAAKVDVNMRLTKTDPDSNVSASIDFSVLEYALSHPSKSDADGHLVFESAELLILNGSDCGESPESHLDLTEEAKSYWKHKIEKLKGVKPFSSSSSSSSVQDSDTLKVSYSSQKRSQEALIQTSNRNGRQAHISPTTAEKLSKSKGGFKSPRGKINSLLRIKNKS